ncbi:cytosolic phospholipase A2-like [Saccostrea cucullata]|uniref:cytosolic phospholipase A2-like n=1 Tax=Saccostrea cuccullata TaxID=36930 RepID=UPI002ED31E4F
MSSSKGFDPYQVFEVEHRSCQILNVKVVRGRNITKGWMDYVDTPDPYLILRIRTAPEGRRRTTTKDNEVNPVWNEEFTFLLDGEVENKLHMILMEANPGSLDQTIGDAWFPLNSLSPTEITRKSFFFNGKSEVELEFSIHEDENPTLRYSLCLCDEEKDFIEKRKDVVMNKMVELLGKEKGPQDIEDVPSVAVIGSGGGFRAMVAYSGVFNALKKSGILDCTSYVCGLSGSSWYLSTLYSHKDWPEMHPGDMQEELMNNIDSSLIWLLSPQSIYRYVDRILEKRRNGQPISFTDIFGHLVGETLLKDRLTTKLSDMREKVKNGRVPLPLMTCVNVKADRSARSFQEWVEFSPYEIGMPKYGAFMNSEYFGSKFFMGKLVKHYGEPPLHFLQGIWGSAFCILFKRLLEDNRNKDPVEMIRQEMVKTLEQTPNEESSDSSEDEEDEEEPETEKPLTEKPGSKNVFSFPPTANQTMSNGHGNPRQRNDPVRRTKQKGYWNNFLSGLLENKRFEMLNSRAGRAGVVHNFMRGLSLQQTFPLSPFCPDNEGNRKSDDFDGLHEMHPTNVKRLYMVDAGLTFNSPYPLVLRAQRAAEIILSFDFSARPSDTTPPFKELKLAEKWASMNKLSFPPIDTTVFDREGMKELYIFKHPTDPYCPIVLHFCLVNIEFRRFKAPGVERKTEEEIKFAAFDIFDDKESPYSTFNFKYSHDAFKRLSKLTEFNTLLHVEDIKNVIAEVIKNKRENGPKIPISVNEIKFLKRVSVKNRQTLSRYISKIEEGSLRRKSGGDVQIQSLRDHGRLRKADSDSVDKMKKRTNVTIKGTRRINIRTSASPDPSLTSPREDEEWDTVDAQVRSRTTKGRKFAPQENFVTAAEGLPGDMWADPVCHSDSEEEFYVCQSDNEENDS